MLEAAEGEQYWQQVDLREGFKMRKKSSSMLMQAQAGETQAARGFWAGPRKKKSKIAGASWRGAAQAASGPQGGLWRLKIWSENLELALGLAAGRGYSSSVSKGSLRLLWKKKSRKLLAPAWREEEEQYW
jgi:hypothetical protein